MSRKLFNNNRVRLSVVLSMVLGLTWWFSVSEPVFEVPYSIVLIEGKTPVAVRPAEDGQIRFPQQGFVPPKLATCVITYEDKRFYEHIGVDFIALGRALIANMRAGKVRQGASTLTMQVARMAGRRKGRNPFRKVWELVQATRIEATYSKDEVLKLWAAHAPFGGNTAGLEAAAWRYFGQAPENLTWAESATLAVLPNAPGLLHPSKGRERLLQKRNTLLRQLAASKHLAPAELAASLAEPLPDKPLPLPRQAPHLLAQQAIHYPKGGRFQLTTRGGVTRAAELVLARHQPALAAMGVGNMACIVVEHATGHVVAYVGNSTTRTDAAPFVDAAQAPRSYGSLLKPFLYANAQDRGLITPNAWLEDVPQLFGRFAPRNFFNTYTGVVPASTALSRSLNLPYVHLLEGYGQQLFTCQMQEAGLAHLTRPAGDYGLSFILGGGEATLWEIARLYSLSAQKVLGVPLRFGVWQDSAAVQQAGKSLPTAAALYTAFEALSEANRPDLDPYWQHIARRQTLAWKTGTSQGLRDAWAVGITPRYTIAIWCGNADGEGRPGLTGIKVAAPMVFELAAHLEPRRASTGVVPFAKPKGGFASIHTCKLSGYRAGPFCDATQYEYVPTGAQPSPICPYHTQVWVDANGQRVDADCYPLSQAHTTTALSLPPLQDYYARKSYPLPMPRVWKQGCSPLAISQIQVLVPKTGTVLHLPKAVAEKEGRVVFTATTTQENQNIYWHLDGISIGQTRGESRPSIQVQIEAGPHQLVLLSEDGAVAESYFTSN